MASAGGGIAGVGEAACVIGEKEGELGLVVLGLMWAGMSKGESTIRAAGEVTVSVGCGVESVSGEDSSCSRARRPCCTGCHKGTDSCG